MLNLVLQFRVAWPVAIVIAALLAPSLQAQMRSLGMRPSAAAPPMALSPAMFGQMPSALLPGGMTLNPNLAMGGVGGLGSPFTPAFANPFGAGGLGGLYGPNSRFGPYGNSYGSAGGLPYGTPYLPGVGGAGYGAPSPAKSKEPKAPPRNDPPQGEKPVAPREPDDPYRATPADGDILSGRALNAVLDGLRRLSRDGDSEGRPDALLRLYADGLKHVNVTRGAGSMAILKDGGRLNWPEALRGSAFRESRERLAARARDTARDAAAGVPVGAVAVSQMADDVDRLHSLLRRDVAALPAHVYVEALAFLRIFDEALAALRQPDAAHHFDGHYALKAQTVLGVVEHMTRNDLRFAPALPGDEAAYRALYQVMAAYGRAAVAQAMPQ